MRAYAPADEDQVYYQGTVARICGGTHGGADPARLPGIHYGVAGFEMNGLVDPLEFGNRQNRLVRRMAALSLFVHGAGLLFGSAVSSLFPDAAYSPVVNVELTDAPMSTLPADPPVPPTAAVLRMRVDSAVSKDTPGPKKRMPASSSAERWLEKLDSGLTGLSDSPVAPSARSTEGIPVRRWENGMSPRTGDFPPAASPVKTLHLGKRLAELEHRVRASGSPGVGTGNESEASVMFGGKGSTAGDPTPPWIRDMIRRKVRGYLPGLEIVYSAALRRDPELRGKILVRFRIDASGKVQHAESAESSLRDAPFLAAVLENVRRWTFEPIDGRTVEVLYPLVFFVPS